METKNNHINNLLKQIGYKELNVAYNNDKIIINEDIYNYQDIKDVICTVEYYDSGVYEVGGNYNFLNDEAFSLANKDEMSYLMSILQNNEEIKIELDAVYLLIRDRFLNEKPLYPFGYGLGFADFSYEDFQIVDINENEIKVRITLTNKGKMKAPEKIQVYAQYTDSRTITPNYQLCAIAVAELDEGETKSVDAVIDRYWIKAVLPDGKRTEPNGNITLFAGGHQPDPCSESLSPHPCLSVQIQ